MDKKSNIIHSEQLLIGYDINDNIMGFIDSRFNEIIIFSDIGHGKGMSRVIT